MRKIFGGALLSQVKCMACKGESNKTDEIMDLSLDLCHSNSLKDALERFFQPEILDGSNKYSCERCKKLSVAKKQMFVSQAPNVLVIQLKRFEGINGGKINRNIEFEEVLLLSSFMFNGNQGSQTEYSLFGSIVHAGFSPDSGHYYAYIKDASGNWYCCNDTQISRSSTQEVLSEKVYILFYTLRNTNPKPNKTAKNGYTSQAKPLHSNVSEAPKPPTTKQNGTCTAKINGSGAPNPHPVKQIGPVKFEIKKSTLNGTAKSEVRNKDNTVIKKGNSPPNSSSSGESKFVNKVKSSLSNGSNGSSKGNVLREVQNIVKKNPGPSFNGDAQCIQPHVSVPERENSSSRNGGSEVSDSLTKESKSSAERKSSDKNVSSCIVRSHQELQKLKDLLVREASSELRSCGWTDEVQSYMRDRKRLCVRQDVSKTHGAALLREQLINESKRTFNSQIPESLKGKLYQRLISFSKDYSLLDS